MDETSSAFGQLMDRVRAGCSEAARELYDRYAPHVHRVINQRLGRLTRRHFDSQDVSQSVWASFFDEPTQRFAFSSPNELIAFLAAIAYNKVVDKTRYALGGGRDVRREQSLDAPQGKAAEHDALNDVLPTPGHTPSKHLMADERWQKLTRNLSPGHVRILEMRLEGHSQEEIARRLGCDRKTVQRLLDRLEAIAFSS